MSLEAPVTLPAMIAIDMDGTLVHPEGHVTAVNCKALQRARDAGSRIVIATGRRHNYAMKVLREASMQPGDVVLSSNGAVARTIEGTLLFRQTMPLATSSRARSCSRTLMKCTAAFSVGSTATPATSGG